jgi:hypothetical protein
MFCFFSWDRLWSTQIKLYPLLSHIYTASEEPVRIQYKCLVPIYVLPEMRLLCLIISKTEL